MHEFKQMGDHHPVVQAPETPLPTVQMGAYPDGANAKKPVYEERIAEIGARRGSQMG